VEVSVQERGLLLARSRLDVAVAVAVAGLGAVVVALGTFVVVVEAALVVLDQLQHLHTRGAEASMEGRTTSQTTWWLIQQ
jgi:cell division protein ZapA (FtsZ GTPase activity inhibitor)